MEKADVVNLANKVAQFADECVFSCQAEIEKEENPLTKALLEDSLKFLIGVHGQLVDAADNFQDIDFKSLDEEQEKIAKENFANIFKNLKRMKQDRWITV